MDGDGNAGNDNNWFDYACMLAVAVIVVFVVVPLLVLIVATVMHVEVNFP